MRYKPKSNPLRSEIAAILDPLECSHGHSLIISEQVLNGLVLLVEEKQRQREEHTKRIYRPL